MNKNVLILLQDQDLSELIAIIIEDDISTEYGAINTVIRRREEDAQKQIDKKHFDLVITDYRVTTAAKMKDVSKGLNFLTKLNSKREKTPSILISHIASGALINGIRKLYKCEPIILEQNQTTEDKSFSTVFKEIFVSQIEKRVKPKKTSIKDAVVSINLDMDKEDWYYKIEGEYGEVIYKESGILEIQTDTLEELIDDSQEIEEMAAKGPIKWEKKLQRIGKRLFREIFINNFKFARDFHRLEGAIGDHENIKFRFIIQEKLHPIHLESIFDEQESQAQSYFMLKSPIYRNLPVYGGFNKPTIDQLSRNKKINFLLIKSDVSDVAEDLDIKFDKLHNVAIETKEIYRLLDANRDTFNIDKIKVIDSGDMPIDFSDLSFNPVDRGEWVIVNSNYKEYLKRTLADNDWQVVHYSGHSYYDNKGRRGYIILPGDDYAQAMNIQIFSELLRNAKTQFIFLCSCHSSEEDIVFELAKNAIPSIVGFRWDLKDVLAAEYAIKFYEHLINGKATLERAFLKARKYMYNEYADNPVWASPMLIMQC